MPSINKTPTPITPAPETEEITDISGIQYESQELSGIDNIIEEKWTPAGTYEDINAAESYASVPAFRVNVPEIQSISTEFVYNFFMPNEREVISNAGEILDISVSRDDEIFFQLKNDRRPRFVKIQFTPPKRYKAIKELRNSKIVRENLDKIIVEGGVNNEEFVSFEIVDSGKEKSLYDMLNASLFFTETEDPKDSPQDAYAKLLEAQSDGSLTGDEKKHIVSALQGMQSKGYKVARSDISPEAAATADDLVSRQNFTIQANKLVFNQIVNSATRIPDSVFQDEFFAAKDYADQAHASALQRNTANSNSENTYTSKVKVIAAKPLASVFGKNSNPDKLLKSYQDYPVIKHCGYIIKKLEITDENKYEDRGYLLSDNPDGLYMIDENIRYGGVYAYEIRSIYYVKMIAEQRDSEDPSLDELSLVEALIASEGKMSGVHCIETVPPPPPPNLRITFDYKQRKPRLNWQFPVNPQRDIKRFQIFRRFNVREPFTLIAEYDFDNSTIRSSVPEVAQRNRQYRFDFPKISYVDHEWEEGEKPIYAIACVDAHGMSSNYGTQMRFKYIKRKNKVVNILISYPNAPKPYPNLLLNRDSFDDAIKVSGYDRMRVYFDPEYYKVTKNIVRTPQQAKKAKKAGKPKERDLNFLRVDPDSDTYKIHMINLDLQKDKTLNIRIGDFSGSPLETMGTNSFSAAGINF